MAELHRRRTSLAGTRLGGAPRGKAVAALVCVLIALLGASPGQAQVPPASAAHDADAPGASGWRFEVTPFLWLPEVQGAIATRGRSASIDVDFGDVFDLLGNGDLFAAGGHFEARYRRLSLFVDAFGGTARPTSDVTVGRAMRSGTADVTLNFAFVEFGPAYRVLDWPRDGRGRPIVVDLLTGGRFMYFYQSITARGSGGAFARYADATSTWVDPFVGGRFRVPLVGPVDVVFRGDIGGFGAGSELAWNLIGGFDYALPWRPLGARTSVVAVYKALDFDYESGGRSDDIVAALDFRGPALGLTFAF